VDLNGTKKSEGHTLCNGKVVPVLRCRILEIKLRMFLLLKLSAQLHA
jgi:hypothetical protein